MKPTAEQIKDAKSIKVSDKAFLHFLWHAEQGHEYRVIKASSHTYGAYIFEKEDLSAVTFNSIRGDESDTWHLKSKIVVVPLSITESTFAEYWTKDFALAALKKIYDAFDAGEEFIDCPQEGLYEPFKAWYKGKVVNSWEVPGYYYNPRRSHEINLFTENANDNKKS